MTVHSNSLMNNIVTTVYYSLINDFVTTVSV